MDPKRERKKRNKTKYQSLEKKRICTRERFLGPQANNLCTSITQTIPKLYAVYGLSSGLRIRHWKCPVHLDPLPCFLLVFMSNSQIFCNKVILALIVTKFGNDRSMTNRLQFRVQTNCKRVQILTNVKYLNVQESSTKCSSKECNCSFGLVHMLCVYVKQIDIVRVFLLFDMSTHNCIEERMFKSLFCCNSFLYVDHQTLSNQVLGILWKFIELAFNV